MLDFNTQPSQNSLMLRRLFILGGTMFIGLLFAGILAMLIGNETTPHLRIVTILQDMLVFILPAVATAMLSSRLPADWLSINRGFSIWALIAAIMLMIVSIPLQNCIIKWNESISLPDSMASLQRWIVSTQQHADASLSLMLGGSSIADLVMNILIVAVFAALSEELFFRGALQRIIRGNRTGAHVSIWVSAIVFSAFHLQFLGFFPRLLLGALFGYMVWWSGSLWFPVTVHALNNSMVVVTRWISLHTGNGSISDTINNIGYDSPMTTAASLLLTIGALWLIRRICLADVSRQRNVAQ